MENKSIKIESIPFCTASELFESEMKNPFPFILQSAQPNERFSFVSSSPFMVISATGSRITVIDADSCKSFTDEPLDFLKRKLKEFELSGHSGQMPLTCGAIGYFGYDLRHQLFGGKISDKANRDSGFPDMFWAFYDSIKCVDHKNMCAYKSSFNSKMDKIKTPKLAFSNNTINSDNAGKANYIKAVEQAKELISAGDIYQVNLSQRFQFPRNSDPFNLYKRLIKINPSPYSAYIDLGTISIISSSPEEFLYSNAGYIRTRPIKGTIRRGRDKAEDAANGRWLMESMKNDAELAMIIDLERNDLGKIAEFGTVRVKEQKVLEEHPTVFHLSSTIEAKLRDSIGPIEIIKATFPGGSVTGAPKLRAMQIIEELELTKRSVYTGSIGYIGFDGTMNLNIAIRTILAESDRYTFQVGGAIVADSDPEEEYQETLDKGTALKASLESI